MTEVNEKVYDDTFESVVETPPVKERQTPTAHPTILSIAAASQSITPWGTAPKRRDKELRGFWHTESWLASVVYGVSIRNASFVWEVVGADRSKELPKNTIRRVERILQQSNRGKGWQSLLTKTCIDLYTQDNGAFWEIIRLDNKPNSPVINIAHLDAAQCQRTGDPEFPVIYTDRLGNEHILRWWQVRTLEEFPSPVESAFDLQYSAVSRALMAAEIIQSISVYKMEKVSGSFTKAIDAISGLTQNDIDDAVTLAKEQGLNQSLYRFSLPVIISGIDPSNSLSHVHIDLASLPDNFNEDTSYRWYVAQLAAAFGVDYQEIAPLMSGSLGSSQQSEIMHLKTHGKGPALIMGLLENIINDGLIPSNVEFRFKEQDLRTESEKAEARFTRAKDRSMRLKSGELDGEAARRIAIADGDLPEWLAKEIDARGLAKPEPVTQPLGAEFGPDQITGGVDSYQERAREKASYGQPAGTVVIPVWATDDLLEVQSRIMSVWGNIPARLTPSDQFHITLVHSPIVEDVDFRAVKHTVGKRIKEMLPLNVKAGDIEIFGEGAVVLRIEDETLRAIQRTLAEEFESRGIAVSAYSVPDNWKGHITLGYVQGASDMLFMNAPFEVILDTVAFTRASYETETEIWGAVPPHMH